MSGTAAFRQILSQLLSSSTHENGYVEVNARNLHDRVLGQRSVKNQMPICCNVMWSEFCDEGGDVVVAAPRKGRGGALTLRFVWPRPSPSLRHGMPQRLQACTPHSGTAADAVRRVVSGCCGFENKTEVQSIFSEPRKQLKDHHQVGEAALVFQQLKGESLRATVSHLQLELKGKVGLHAPDSINSVDMGLGLRAALLVKAVSAQVNEVVHALCILLTIPRIMEQGECIEAVSLAAGNFGTPYDLETNLRVAEFKIIDWKGADSVREAQLFKDFFNLAEAPTKKRKYLYVTGSDWARKALARERKCSGSIKHSLFEKLRTEYPEVVTFGDYFRLKESEVSLVGLDDLLEEFCSAIRPTSEPVGMRRELKASELALTEDWHGNNAAFTCPVCSQVFIVSAALGGGKRKCPGCGKSTGVVHGGKNSGGTAVLEY